MKYNDANTYYKSLYGTKVYKASISLDVTCPNRDGTCGTGGCIFCSEGGSGEFASVKTDSVTSQINDAISKLSKKVKPGAKYIAYFQNFTNTHCEPEYLKGKLLEATKHPEVVAISIATRPDCLPDDILNVIEQMNILMPIYIELGLQTSSDVTANLINRCYPTAVYMDAVKKLKNIGVNVITHLILGLPGEGINQMKESVKTAVDAGTDGIKFTCLYVLKGTVLEQMYGRGEIELPSMEEYFDVVEELLKLLPNNVVVHRITGDGPKSLLVAPMWTSNKRNVVNYINRRFG